MPGKNGFDILQEMIQKNMSPQVKVFTVYADVNNAIHSTKLGARSFICKLYNVDDLLISIQKVLIKNKYK